MVGTLLYGDPLAAHLFIICFGSPIIPGILNDNVRRVDINIDSTPHRTWPNLALVQITRSLGREIGGRESVGDIM